MKFPRPRHVEMFPAGRTSDNGSDFDRLEEGYKKALIKEAQAPMTEKQKAIRGL
jgi:hypothetical protein